MFKIFVFPQIFRGPLSTHAERLSLYANW